MKNLNANPDADLICMAVCQHFGSPLNEEPAQGVATWMLWWMTRMSGAEIGDRVGLNHHDADLLAWKVQKERKTNPQISDAIIAIEKLMEGPGVAVAGTRFHTTESFAREVSERVKPAKKPRPLHPGKKYEQAEVVL